MILLNEWRFFRRTTIFWIVLMATWSCLALAGWNGVQRWQRDAQQAKSLNLQIRARMDRNRTRLSQINAAIASGHPELISKSELDWGPRQTLWVDAWDPPTSVLPAAPLAYPATGRSDTLPHSYVSSAWRGLEPNAPTTDDPLMLLTGDFDMKFAIMAVLPLILVLTCFDLVATEREDGTLRLLLSQSTSFRSLLLCRAAVRGSLVMGSLIVAVVLVALFVLLHGGTIWFWRAAAYLGVSVLYLLFWLLVAVLVNTLGRSGTVNSLLLGGTWLTLVILLPGLMPVIAESVAPTPSRAVYIDFARAARLGIYNGSVDEKSTQQRQAEMVNAFLRRHPEWAADPKLSRAAMLGAARGEEHSAMLANITDQFDAARTRQQKVIRLLAVVTIASQTDTILTELSGNSDSRQTSFLRQSRQFFDASKHYFWPRIFRDEIFTPERFADIPLFSFREQTAADVFGPCVFPAILFSIWGCIVFVVTLLGLGRKPVL
jgi:ABC-2 type transport system permease protein